MIEMLNEDQFPESNDSAGPALEGDIPSDQVDYAGMASVYEGVEPETLSSPAEEPILEEVVVEPPAGIEEKPPQEPPKVPEETPPSAEGDLPASPEAYPEWYDKQTKALEENYYKLPEDLKDRLDPDLAEVLPGLAAKVHMSVMQSTLVAVMNSLPAYIEQLNQQTTRNTQLETQFFDAWPQLAEKKNELTSEIVQAIQAVRTVNPKASLEDVIGLSGAMVVTKHKLQEKVSPPSATRSVPPPPAAARTSPRAGTSVGAREEPNPFAVMAEELDG